MALEQEQAPPAPIEGESSPIEEVPVLAVRDTVIFPGALLPITIGRPTSVALVQSLGENRTLAVVAQQDPRVDVPGPLGQGNRHRLSRLPTGAGNFSKCPLSLISLPEKSWTVAGTPPSKWM